MRLQPSARPTSAAQLTAEEKAAIDALPWRVGATAINILPRGGETPRFRTDRDNGRTVYRIDKTIDGLDWEARIAEDGTLIRIEQDLRFRDLPAIVLAAANKGVPGYEVNPEDTPMSSIYEVHMRTTATEALARLCEGLPAE